MIDLLGKRRSIRKFSEKEIESEKIEILKTALLFSPSSRNIKPCEFIFIQNKDMLRALSKCRPHGAEFIKDSNLSVIVLANTSKSDTWIEDCSIASIILQLTAESLDLGSCWTQVRNRFYDEHTKSSVIIKEILSIPFQYEVESIISIGYKDEYKEPYSIDSLPFDKIHLEKFK